MAAGIEQVQALTNILISALCCHSNETCALIAYPSNSVQLKDTPYHYPAYIRVRLVV